VLRELSAAKLFWLECPISEQPEHWAALARLRALANEFGIRLAAVPRPRSAWPRFSGWGCRSSSTS